MTKFDMAVMLWAIFMARVLPPMVAWFVAAALSVVMFFI